MIKQYSMQCECVGKLQKEEVESGEFVNWDELVKWVEKSPKQFTPGFIAAFERYETA
jgi:isopentenyldiphosphate isomerase